MATAYFHRLLFVIPASMQAGMNTWWTNNLGVAQTFSVGLSVTGLTPITHYWMCGSFTAAELKKIAARLCTLAGLALPANWDTLTRAEKKDWFVSNIPAIKANTGIVGLLIDDNDGVWSDYALERVARGLQTIRGALV